MKYRIVASIGCVVLAACSLGAITGVGSVAPSYVGQGAFAANEEGTRVYAGTWTVGTKWNHTLQIRAFDRTTGAQTGLWQPISTVKRRAIATDPTTDRVWVGSDGGHLTQLSADLTTVTASVTSAFAPFVTTNRRMCDLEMHPSGLRIGTFLDPATGYADVVWSYPDANQTSGWNGGSFGNLTVPHALSGPGCPRVSYDGTKVRILVPKLDCQVLYNDPACASALEVPVVYTATVSTSGGAATWPGLIVDTSAYTVLPAPVSAKYGYTDIAAGAGGYALVEEYLYDSSTTAWMHLHDSTQARVDTAGIRELRAADVADTARSGDRLWWFGYDLTSAKDFGTWAVL